MLQNSFFAGTNLDNAGLRCIRRSCRHRYDRCRVSSLQPAITVSTGMLPTTTSTLTFGRRVASSSTPRYFLAGTLLNAAAHYLSNGHSSYTYVIHSLSKLVITRELCNDDNLIDAAWLKHLELLTTLTAAAFCAA